MECLQNYQEVESFKTDYVSFEPIEYDEIKLDSYIQGALVLTPGKYILFNCEVWLEYLYPRK